MSKVGKFSSHQVAHKALNAIAETKIMADEKEPNVTSTEVELHQGHACVLISSLTSLLLSSPKACYFEVEDLNHSPILSAWRR